MCSRYYMEENSKDLKPYVDRVKALPLSHRMVAAFAKPLRTKGEIKPTDIAPVIAPSWDRKLTVYPMLWGFTNPKEGGSPLFNCRVESAAAKPFWKEAWRKRRCVIPASYYFEWEHLKSSDGKTQPGQKFLFQPKGCTITYLAGLYRLEEKNGVKFPVFTVLTREAGESIRFIHERMPVVLPRNAAKSWLDLETDPKEIVKQAFTDMYFDKAA